jgi:hypothetical protein
MREGPVIGFDDEGLAVLFSDIKAVDVAAELKQMAMAAPPGSQERSDLEDAHGAVEIRDAGRSTNALKRLGKRSLQLADEYKAPVLTFIIKHWLKM